jgi:hypothetical protein
MSTFQTLVAIDCSKHVEKKGKFSYLSWPFAVRMLRENAPDATWTVSRFDGLPFQTTPCGTFVEVSVTVGGITLAQIHPVLNANNKPIAEPTAFDINTSIQRCLVKAIALHGLGLYIYAGEDLPNPTADAEVSEADAIADVEKLQELRSAALEGIDALKTAWKALDEAQRTRLADDLPALKKAATAANNATSKAA